MKHFLLLIILLNLLISCNQKQDGATIFSADKISLPYEIDHTQQTIPEYKELIDSSVFVNAGEKFEYIQTGKLYNRGRIIFNDSMNVLMVSENPTDDFEGETYLISFNRNREPVDILGIFTIDEVKKTNITNDTIFCYIDLQYSGWLHKYNLNSRGEFELLDKEMVWEEDYNPN
jgi:hypothetical protein